VPQGSAGFPAPSACPVHGSFVRLHCRWPSSTDDLNPVYGGLGVGDIEPQIDLRSGHEGTCHPGGTSAEHSGGRSQDSLRDSQGVCGEPPIRVSLPLTARSILDLRPSLSTSLVGCGTVATPRASCCYVRFLLAARVRQVARSPIRFRPDTFRPWQVLFL